MNAKKVYPAYMMVVPLIVFGVFFLLPSTIGYMYAFTDWSNYVSDVSFVGLDNFKAVFQNRSLTTAMVNSLVYASVKTVGVTVLGFVFALILNRGLRTRNLLRTVYFLPSVLSALVVGLIFSALFDARNGAVNKMLIALGLDSWTQPWLGTRIPAMATICMAEIWRGLGYAMVITLAGLQSVSKDYLEAATVDGATASQKFRHVTLPLIMPSVNVNILFSLIYGLKMFDLIYVLTQGGPGHQTESFGTLMMNEMSKGKYAQSVAINLVFTVILVIAAVLYQKYASRWEEISG